MTALKRAYVAIHVTTTVWAKGYPFTLFIRIASSHITLGMSIAQEDTFLCIYTLRVFVHLQW